MGKTAVAWEIYARLAGRGAAPAYVDVDQVGMCYPPPPGDPDRHALKARNVAALGTNFAGVGARCLVVSGVCDPERGTGLGASQVVVGRLRADRDELRARLDRRPGSVARPDADAVAAAASAFDQSSYADWCLDTTGLSIAAVADRVLAEAGTWPPAAGPDRPDPPLPARGPIGGEVLWLSGPTGVGKSAVGFRAYLDLLEAGATAAYVDADQIAFCSPAPDDHALRAHNVAALWRTFRAAGAERAVVVGPVPGPAAARRYERALPATRFTWVRLHAGDEELTRRILTRQQGGSWAQPGDPLRDRPTEELLGVARRAIAEAEARESHPVGHRIDVGDLSADEAAAAVLAVVPWTRPA